MNEDLMVLAKLRLEELLTFFGINAAVTATEKGDNGIDLSVEIPDSGRLIGHRGETLAALQHLVNVMVRKHTDERVFVGVDISGYKQMRAEHLAGRALETAKLVAESGQAKRLRPMNAAERRVVHMALADVDTVVTESEGEGPNRRVVIKKAD